MTRPGDDPEEVSMMRRVEGSSALILGWILGMAVMLSTGFPVITRP